MVILALISLGSTWQQQQKQQHQQQAGRTTISTHTKNARSTCHICHMSWRTSFIMRRLLATSGTRQLCVRLTDCLTMLAQLLWRGGGAGSRLHRSGVSPCPGSNCGRRATSWNFNYTFNLRWAFCVSQCNINSSQRVVEVGRGSSNAFPM